MELIGAFLMGLMETGKVMGLFLGGLCAVLAAALILLFIAGILAGLFDFVTWLIARRMAKSGKVPATRLGRILVGSVGHGSSL